MFRYQFVNRTDSVPKLMEAYDNEDKKKYSALVA